MDEDVGDDIADQLSRTTSTIATSSTQLARTFSTGTPSFASAGAPASAVARSAQPEQSSFFSRRISGPNVAHLARWTPTEVKAWLVSVGLSPFGDLFEEHKICGDILLDVESRDLQEMGINLVGDRKRVLKALDALRSDAERGPQPKLDIAVLGASPLVRRAEKNSQVWVPLEPIDLEKEQDLIREAARSAEEFVGRGCLSISFEVGTFQAFSHVIQLGAVVLMLTAHTTPEGEILLETVNGETAHFEPSPGLAQLRGSASTPLPVCVVLSSCYSRMAAHAFLNHGTRHVVAVERNETVLDSAARTFNAQFLHALLVGCTVATAFSHAVGLVRHSPYIQAEAAKFVLLPEDVPGRHDVVLFPSGPARSPPLLNDDVALSEPCVPSTPRHCFGSALASRFVGRQRDLWQLLRALTKSRCVVVCGIGGVGKASLCQSLAEHLEKRSGRHCAHGLHFVSLRGFRSVHCVQSQLINALTPELSRDPGETAKNWEEVITTLGERLLIITHAEEVLHFQAQELAELLNSILSSAPRLKMVITSRRTIPAEMWPNRSSVLPLHVYLRHLEPEFGAKLLQNMVPTLDKNTTTKISALCGHLPLALHIVGHRLVIAPDPVVEAKDFILETDCSLEKRASLLFSESIAPYAWKALDGTHRAALVALSLFRGVFDNSAAAAILGVAADRAQVMLRNFVDQCLIEKASETHYRIHTSIHTKVQQEFASHAVSNTEVNIEVDLGDAHVRFALHFLTLLLGIAKVVQTDRGRGDTGLEMLRCFDTHRADVELALSLAGHSDVFVAMVQLGRDVFETRLSAQRRVAIYERLLGLIMVKKMEKDPHSRPSNLQGPHDREKQQCSNTFKRAMTVFERNHGQACSSLSRTISSPAKPASPTYTRVFGVRTQPSTPKSAIGAELAISQELSTDTLGMSLPVPLTPDFSRESSNGGGVLRVRRHSHHGNPTCPQTPDRRLDDVDGIMAENKTGTGDGMVHKEIAGNELTSIHTTPKPVLPNSAPVVPSYQEASHEDGSEHNGPSKQKSWSGRHVAKIVAKEGQGRSESSKQKSWSDRQTSSTVRPSERTPSYVFATADSSALVDLQVEHGDALGVAVSKPSWCSAIIAEQGGKLRNRLQEALLTSTSRVAWPILGGSTPSSSEYTPLLWWHENLDHDTIFFDVLLQLSAGYGSLGKYKHAAQLLRKALLRSEELSQDSASGSENVRADILGALAGVLCHQGFWQEAEAMLWQARQLAKLGGNGELYVKLTCELAEFHQKYKGNLEMAQKFFREGLDKRVKTLGLHHIDTAHTLNAVGVFCALKGDYEEARRYILDAIQIREKLLGQSHILVAEAYHNLGNVMEEVDDKTLALQLYEHALRVKQQVLPPGHVSIAESQNSLTVLYSKSKKHEECVALLRQWLHQCIQHVGERHPTTATLMMNLGHALHQHATAKRENISSDAFDARLEEAEQYLLRALEVKLQHFHKRHPCIGLCRGNLGYLHYKKGNFSKAERHFKEALKIHGKQYGKQHPKYAWFAYWLAKTLYQKQSRKRGHKYLQEARLISEKILAQDTKGRPGPFNTEQLREMQEIQTLPVDADGNAVSNTAQVQPQEEAEPAAEPLPQQNICSSLMNQIPPPLPLPARQCRISTPECEERRCSDASDDDSNFSSDDDIDGIKDASATDQMSFSGIISQVRQQVQDFESEHSCN